MPYSRVTKAFSDLRHAIRKKPKKATLVVLGDFNAHIGRKDTKKFLKHGTIANNIYHEETNMNGEILLDTAHSHKLSIETTAARKSCMVTWEGGNKKNLYSTTS